MKKGMVGRLVFGVILLISLSVIVSASSLGLNCSVVQRNSCVAIDGDYILMGLSAQTNAHVEYPDLGTYPYVLCCGFGTGDKNCNGMNKMIGISSSTNAHVEAPEQTNYLPKLCYEDLACISGTDTCGTGSAASYTLGIISISSITNAHAGDINEFPTKICCKSPLYLSQCLLQSAEWNIDSAIDGQTVRLFVKGSGAECDRSSIQFSILGTPTNTNASTVSFNGNNATSTWIAEWHGTGLFGLGNPQYQFNASLVGSPQRSIVSSDPLLTVIKQSQDYCVSITTCADYNVKSECESDSSLCKVAKDSSLPGVDCSNPHIFCGCSWDTETSKCGFGYSEIQSPLCDSGYTLCQDSDGINYCYPGTSCPGGTGGGSSSCNNGSLEHGEACDGSLFGSLTCSSFGFTGGSLTCNSNCNSVSTSACTPQPSSSLSVCNNGSIDPGEVCDNSLFGGKACSNFDSFTGGSLTCTADCKGMNTASCTPAANNGGGTVVDIIVTNGGSGYTSPPDVTFTGGGGSGATATAVINSTGSVVDIIINNGGSGYTTEPTVTITGGGGSGATAVAIIGATGGGPASNNDGICGANDGCSSSDCHDGDQASCVSGSTCSGGMCYDSDAVLTNHTCNYGFTLCRVSGLNYCYPGNVCPSGQNPISNSNGVCELGEGCLSADCPDGSQDTCSNETYCISNMCSSVEDPVVIGSFGGCRISQTIEKNCDEEPVGYKIISWTGTWTGEGNSGDAYNRCIAGGRSTVPCPAQVQLPFFDVYEVIITVVVIALIYVSLVFRKKAKRKKK